MPRERNRFFWSVVFDVVVTLLDIGFLLLLLALVHFYMQPSDDHFIPIRFRDHPYWVFAVFCSAFGLKNILAHLVLKQQNRFAFGVASRLSESELAQYLQSDYDNFVHVDSSASIRKISHQPIEFCSHLLRSVQVIYGQAALILFTSVLICIYNPQLMLLLTGALLLPVLLTAYVLRTKLTAVRKETKQAGEKSLQHLMEALAGFVESRIFFKKDFFIRRYMQWQQKQNDLLARQQVIHGIPSRLIETFAIAGIFFLFAVSRGGSQFMLVASFTAAAYKLIPGIVKILSAFGQIRTYGFVLHDFSEKIRERKGADTEQKIAIDSIELRGVDFAYGEKEILGKLDVCFKSGDLAGITGMSGRGKTTLIHLVLGFISPQAGNVYINGRPLHSIDRQAWWHAVSYVKQQPFFIHDSVFTNVALDESLDADRLQEIEEATGFQAFMNGSVHKTIRENGKNISGGQRQRIALARALYKDFDLLILDEPFSEMDRETELQMMKRLQAFAREGKIVLLVTHHQWVLEHCNKIVDLDRY